MREHLLTAAALAALALSPLSAHAAQVLDVSRTSGCGKTTCFDDNGVFTQTYAASGFSGPVTISQLLMDRGVLGALDSKTFRLSFTLNGQEVGTWGQFTMSGIGGDALWFAGDSFVWNPEDGDLVLVLTLAPPPKGGMGGGFLAALNSEDGEADPAPSGAPFQARSQDDTASESRDFQGAAAPEPATWALMIGGFGLTGAALRRRAPATA